MRTKTLFLTALSSMSALGLMAQTSTNVYSLNAVGYINVVCPPGFSMIADQLWASGGNTISNLLRHHSAFRFRSFCVFKRFAAFACCDSAFLRFLPFSRFAT
jgi:hypothetical protein